MSLGGFYFFLFLLEGYWGRGTVGGRKGGEGEGKTRACCYPIPVPLLTRRLLVTSYRIEPYSPHHQLLSVPIYGLGRVVGRRENHIQRYALPCHKVEFFNPALLLVLLSTRLLSTLRDRYLDWHGVCPGRYRALRSVEECVMGRFHYFGRCMCTWVCIFKGISQFCS